MNKCLGLVNPIVDLMSLRQNHSLHKSTQEKMEDIEGQKMIS